MVPPEFFGRRSDYIDAVSSWCADAAAVGADSVDVNCEDGRFTEEEARWILNAGRRAGLLPRLHAGGHTHNGSGSGAARVAAELGCASADLLHAATDEDVAALSRGGVAAVISPGSALQQSTKPPVRALLDKGVVLALGSDHTPGGVGITSMPLVIALAVSYLGLSVTEALRAATLGGAYALRAPDRGAMVRGRLADIVLWDADHEGAFAWNYGLPPRRVWRGGEPVTPDTDPCALHALSGPLRGRGMLAGMGNLVAVTLIVGEEEFLVDRAVREALAQARAALAEASGGGDGDLHDLEASALAQGELAALTSPSLFGGGAVVIVRNAQNAGKEIAAELAKYAKSPAPDAAVILTHAGGAKGKALVTDLAKAGAQPG